MSVRQDMSVRQGVAVRQRRGRSAGYGRSPPRGRSGEHVRCSFRLPGRSMTRPHFAEPCLKTVTICVTTLCTVDLFGQKRSSACGSLPPVIVTFEISSAWNTPLDETSIIRVIGVAEQRSAAKADHSRRGERDCEIKVGHT